MLIKLKLVITVCIKQPPGPCRHHGHLHSLLHVCCYCTMTHCMAGERVTDMNLATKKSQNTPLGGNVLKGDVTVMAHGSPLLPSG